MMSFHLEWWVSTLNDAVSSPQNSPTAFTPVTLMFQHLLFGMLWHLVQFSNVLLMKLKILKLIFLKFLWEPAVWASVFLFSSLKRKPVQYSSSIAVGLGVSRSNLNNLNLRMSSVLPFLVFLFRHFLYTYNCTPTYHWRSYWLAMLVKPFQHGL